MSDGWDPAVTRLGDLTRDSLLNGALTLWQPARGQGYRFNLDPVLLAGFAMRAGHVLDLGAGCGVIGLLLLVLGKAREVTAVEIQPELAKLVAKNAEENGLADRVRVITGDLRKLSLPEADLAIFNPPYFPSEQGRRSPNAGRAIGRTESHGSLADFVTAGAQTVRAGARLAAIMPIRRRLELGPLFASHALTLIRQREVCARPGQMPRYLLWEAARVQDMPGEPLSCEQALIVHGETGRAYSPEVRALLRE